MYNKKIYDKIKSALKKEGILMKKILCAILASLMIISFCACADSQSSAQQETTVAVETTAPQTDEKLGLADTDVLEWVDYKEYNLNEDVPVKNIILMIGDGMGKNTIKAAEIVKGDKLVMSGIKNQTTVTTYSQSVTDGHAEFTDSAASATAISTGVKTDNGYIGLDPDGNEIETICEYVQKLGMKTGLVDRHYVSHATPAGMVAHNNSRSNYQQILRGMIKADVNVMFGGGSQFYKNSPKVQNTVKECGYTYIDNEQALLDLRAGDDKVLGMFAYDNMGSATIWPSLTTMTSKALELLDNEKGFFLMVEGSNIDVYAHNGDMKNTIEQMQAFDHTIDYVLQWAEKNPGTLVIVTADHETGGVQIPENATVEDINDTCFTSNGEHTNADVALMAGGAHSKGLCEKDLIDNTDIAKYMRKVLEESH